MFELRLENEAGNIVNINDNEKFVVLSCSGLNPPSAAIFTSKSPNRKGVKYNGSSLDERNVIITIKLLGDIEESRIALYDWVNTESYVKIYYRNGKRNVYIEGYVQDCPIDLFTDNEVVSVAIICPDPYFRDLENIAVDISTLLAHFTFPFAIAEPGIPMSTVKDSNHTPIINTGAETGCIITLSFVGICSSVTIYNARNTTERMVINYTFQAGDIVTIDTEHSPKRIELIDASGVKSNILRYVENDPEWFTIKNGLNEFGFSAITGQSNMSMTISFTNKYQGV